MTGDIMAVSRLRMATDGEGVSTLVTFYDCPLHCKYCVNEYCHRKEDRLPRTPEAAYRPEELIEVLRKDEIYYLMTGGGIYPRGLQTVGFWMEKENRDIFECSVELCGNFTG